MAIYYSVKVKTKKLDSKILIKAFEDLGFRSKNTEILPNGICMDFFEELGFDVYLTDAGNYPYNSWETIFGDKEFVFERTLQFRFDKEYEDWEKRYSIMLTIIFGLLSGIRDEAILINSGGTELCFWKENGDIILNNQEGIWNHNCFKDIIRNKNISDSM